MCADLGESIFPVMLNAYPAGAPLSYSYILYGYARARVDALREGMVAYLLQVCWRRQACGSVATLAVAPVIP
jgi:hypothetical protein